MTPAGVENLAWAAVLFALIGLGLVALAWWATKDTSHLTPEEAVNHRERVIKVDKGLAATQVALAVLDQGIRHAGPGPAKRTTASDVAPTAIGLGLYALSRHAERQKDIADSIDPDLPPDQLHAARVAAETARRRATSPYPQPYPPQQHYPSYPYPQLPPRPSLPAQQRHPENLGNDDFLDALRNYNIGITDVEETIGLAVRVGQMARQGFSGSALTDMLNAARPDLTGEQSALFVSFALRVYAPQEYARMTTERASDQQRNHTG